MFLANDTLGTMKYNDDHAAWGNLICILRAHKVPFEAVEYRGFFPFGLGGLKGEEAKRATEGKECTQAALSIEIGDNLWSVLYVPEKLSEVKYLKWVIKAAYCGCTGCQNLMDREKPIWES